MKVYGTIHSDKRYKVVFEDDGRMKATADNFIYSDAIKKGEGLVAEGYTEVAVVEIKKILD